MMDWLAHLPLDARARCLQRLHRLELQGIALRRPEADYLQDGIYELRAKSNRVNYRMLYFFPEKTPAIVVSHGFAKQRAKVPRREIGLALARKRAFEADPRACSAGFVED